MAAISHQNEDLGGLEQEESLLLNPQPPPPAPPSTLGNVTTRSYGENSGELKFHNQV